MKWNKPEDKLPKTQKRVVVAYAPYSPEKLWRTVAVYIPKMTVPEEEFMAEDYRGDGDYSEEKDVFYTPEGWYESQVEPEVNWKLSGPVKFWTNLPDLPL